MMTQRSSSKSKEKEIEYFDHDLWITGYSIRVEKMHFGLLALP
jgi:hypothetical protein